MPPVSPFLKRLVFCGLVPAVAGAVLGWTTRSMMGDREVGTHAGESIKPPLADAIGSSAGVSTVASPRDSALAAQQQYCDRLRGAGLEQMYELLVESAQEPDAYRRQALHELIVEQMARTDPAGAWDLLVAATGGLYTGELLSAWARLDPAAAMAWAEGRENADHFLGALIDGLGPDDVDAFAAILPRLKPDQLREDRVESVFHRLGAEDSERGRSLLSEMPAGRARNAAASAMAEGWARGDAKASYAWAKDLTDPAERESALRGVFRAWAETDPQGVASRLDELAKDDPKDEKGNPLARGDSPVRAIVRAWAAQDPHAAAVWLRERSGDGRDSFNDIFRNEILSLRENWSVAEITEMARRPGEKVITDRKDQQYSSSRGWSDGHSSYQIIGEFGGPMSLLGVSRTPGESAVRFEDPAKAFDELTRLPPDATRQHILQEVANQWATHDPAAAREKLRTTDDDLLKLSLINALSIVARHTLDLDLAAEVAAALPPNSAHGPSALHFIYSEMALREPERAYAMLAGDLDPARKAALAAELAANHATYDPAGAIAWAAQQPDEALQSAATRSAVTSWAQADAYAVSEWLAAQPAGTHREVAVEALVESLSDSAPEDALAWAGSLTDRQKREDMQATVVMSFAHEDSSRARHLLESVPFSDQRRQSLLDQIESVSRPRF